MRSQAMSAHQTWPCLTLFRSDYFYYFIVFADRVCWIVDSAAFCHSQGRVIALVLKWYSDVTVTNAGCSSSYIGYADQLKTHLSYL
jgi:hypothetical protein